jgi:hypothetical protein
VTNPLLLNSRDAAKLLSVSERTLWGLTAPRGPIRAIRVAKRLQRYAVLDLERWIAAELSAGAAGEPSGGEREGRDGCPSCGFHTRQVVDASGLRQRKRKGPKLGRNPEGSRIETGHRLCRDDLRVRGTSRRGAMRPALQ